MENTSAFYIFIFVIVTAAIGFPLVYFGDKCKNAELRAANKNDTCKHIHNDDSAAALLWIGFILIIPLQIVMFLMFICFCYCAGFCLASILEDSSCSNSVAPSDGGGGGGFVLSPQH
ncbi:hypothetical protein OS493_017316 [Desmophyllum pertusum]|uniref:Transmembrane protein n=1 Tax=Desmophyllum pertusum TaxID=174260 RepID=A0A9X0DB59_9CNID|nr:hypothetical protein OS493_017316 [Desmophyllum pertusum]